MRPSISSYGDKNGFKATWNEITQIRVGDVVAVIRASDHHRPRYSFEICFVARDFRSGEERDPLRYRNISGNAPSVADATRDAVLEAEAYIADLLR